MPLSKSFAVFFWSLVLALTSWACSESNFAGSAGKRQSSANLNGQPDAGDGDGIDATDTGGTDSGKVDAGGGGFESSDTDSGGGSDSGNDTDSGSDSDSGDDTNDGDDNDDDIDPDEDSHSLSTRHDMRVKRSDADHAMSVTVDLMKDDVVISSHSESYDDKTNGERIFKGVCRTSGATCVRLTFSGKKTFSTPDNIEDKGKKCLIVTSQGNNQLRALVDSTGMGIIGSVCADPGEDLFTFTCPESKSLDVNCY